MTRIRSVISDLRAFAYPSKISEENEFSLEEVLTTAKRLTAHEVRDIPIVGEGLEGCTALGAKTQIVHVLMNLLVNSAHALQKCPADRQGKIVVSAKNQGDRLIVTVRDNGVGVPTENLARLFEPFFTTKDPGQGTGLGLSISHTIIKNHGGEMHVASEVGQWTELSFDLPLPAARRAAA
jgi:two-component system sensor histidine kinase PhcS